MKAWIKILLLAVMSVLIVALPSPWIFLMGLAVVLFIAVLGASPVRLLRMLMPALFFIIIISALQAFLQGSGDIVAEWWILRLTTGGLGLAALSVLRMILLYLAGSAVTATTGESELTRAVERAFLPIDRICGSRIGKDIATMVMLALAFIPMVYEEYVSIKAAQEARGVRYGALKGFVAITVPLVYSLSQRADDIALALEARCYGLDK